MNSGLSCQRVFRLSLFALIASLAAAQPIFIERHSNSAAGTLRGFAASDSALVAVGDGGRILSSVDGIAWQARNSKTADALRGVTYGNGAFVAVGDNGRVLVSSDGAQWSDAARSGTSSRLNAVLYANGRYVGAGENGTIVTSADGQNWTAAQSGVTTSLRGVGWLPTDAFVVCGEQGVILTSVDASVWTLRPAGTTQDIEASCANAGLFVGSNSVILSGGISISAAGATWSASPALNTATGHWRGVALGPLFRLVVGDGGSVAGMGINGPFRSYESGTTRDLTSVSFAKNTFFAVGANETILQGAPYSSAAPDEIGNLSTRSQVSTGSGTLISGFVISGSGTKRLLVRAGGPSLKTFGVSLPLAQPVLTVFDNSGRMIDRNSGWTTNPKADQLRATASNVGAYAYPDSSADSALLLNLAPGLYTAQVSGASGGIGLVEIYDTEIWPAISTSRVVNLSSRCFVGAGQATAITGLSLPQNRRLLIRAVGPTLDAFGVQGVLANPMIDLIRPEYVTPLHGGGVLNPAVTAARNDDWNSTVPPIASAYLSDWGSSDEIRATTTTCGAFQLPEGSKDAAMLVTLKWSPMTLQVRGSDGGSGIALVEVYDLGAR